MNKKRHHILCPKCGGEKFVKGVFGSICGDCFYEEKNTPSLPKSKEREIQKQVLDYLAILENQGKIYYFRTGSGAIETKRGNWFKTGKPGCPDIICCYRGRFIGFEIKGNKGKLSPVQIETRKIIEKCFGEYHIIWDLNDVIKILNYFE